MNKKTVVGWCNIKMVFFNFVQRKSRIYIHKVKCLFFSPIWPLLDWVLLFGAAGAVLKIGSSLKPIHHKEI
jgi:hypothetical protein